MNGNQSHLNDEQLNNIATQVEQEIVKRYKRKFVGVIAAFTVCLSLISFFGINSFKKSIADAVIQKLIKGDFKTEIQSKVAEKISKESQKILEQIEKHRNEAEKIVNDFEREHKEILEAASNEFERTISVLKIVRENTENRNNNKGFSE